MLLALLHQRGCAAEFLQNRDISESAVRQLVLALDMAAIVAGTKYRGDFEERFRNLLEELQKDRNTILFIDEIHVVVGPAQPRARSMPPAF